MQRLEDKKAYAVTVGDVIYFRPDASVSDVLEESYHFKQNRKNLNVQYGQVQREILNEIDAKEYLISVSKKFHIPEDEMSLTVRQLESYKKQMNDLIERGEWDD